MSEITGHATSSTALMVICSLQGGKRLSQPVTKLIKHSVSSEGFGGFKGRTLRDLDVFFEGNQQLKCSNITGSVAQQGNDCHTGI